MERRKFLTTTGIASVAAVAAPAIVRARATNWRMTTAFPMGQPFYSTGPGSSTDFAKRVEEMSDGRLKIKVYHAGELIPAFQGFDAVRQGIVHCNSWVSYFGAGKVPAAQFFGAVPFGMSTQGKNAWFYSGDGIKLWHEVYQPLGLVAFPMGATGVQMTGWFNKEIKSLKDMKGLRLRIPGLAGKAYARIGVEVKLLPAGEVFPALERGVIDAAEWVGPAQDKTLGLNKAAEYYYTTGWHEPTAITELSINKAAWAELPSDLKSIVVSAATACNLLSHSWAEANNAKVLKEFAEAGTKIRTLPADVVKALKREMVAVYSELAEKDVTFKKVMTNYFAFKKDHDLWADASEKVWHNELRKL
ncbi:MAG: Monocarboxylate 2-oxoacid-binding periplasmic protein [Hyphomicrobiaceae bacterium hypho_1]